MFARRGRQVWRYCNSVHVRRDSLHVMMGSVLTLLRGVTTLRKDRWKKEKHLLIHLFQECDDVSDEKNCQTIYIDPEKYLKSKPPPSADSTGRLPIILRLF